MASNGQTVTAIPTALGDNKLLAPSLPFAEKVYRALNYDDDIYRNRYPSSDRTVTEETPYSDKGVLSEDSLRIFYRDFERDYGKWEEAVWLKFQQRFFPAHKIDFAKANKNGDQVVDEDEFISALGLENITIDEGEKKEVIKGITRKNFFARFGSNEPRKPLERNPEYEILNSLIRNSVIKQKDPLLQEAAEKEARKICDIVFKDRPAIDMQEFEEFKNLVPAWPDFINFRLMDRTDFDGVVEYHEFFRYIVDLLEGSFSFPVDVPATEENGGSGKKVQEITDCMAEEMLSDKESYVRYEDADTYQSIYDMVRTDALTTKETPAKDRARKALKGDQKAGYYAMVAKIEQVLETDTIKYKITPEPPNTCLNKEIEYRFNSPDDADIEMLIGKHDFTTEDGAFERALTTDDVFKEIRDKAEAAKEHGEKHLYILKILSGDKREMSNVMIDYLREKYKISIYPLTEFFIDWLTKRGY
jgi:hypothetical protein